MEGAVAPGAEPCSWGYRLALPLGGVQAQQAGKGGAQLGAGHDGIDKSMILEIFGCLEVVREFLSQGLLDHAATSEANQGLGFSQD